VVRSRAWYGTGETRTGGSNAAKPCSSSVRARAHAERLAQNHEVP
jgi:hypothetical protein